MATDTPDNAAPPTPLVVPPPVAAAPPAPSVAVPPMALSDPHPDPVPAPQHFSFSDRLAALAHGVEHAANALYHDVLKVEATVTNWTQDNPEVAHIIRGGVQVALAAIERTGFPVDLVEVSAIDIFAALRGMAALDNSVVGVSSGGVK